MAPQSGRQVWTVIYRNPQNVAGCTVVAFLDDDGSRACEFAVAHRAIYVRYRVIPGPTHPAAVPTRREP